jgi:predicted PurR-regulated permease PerM
MAETSHYFLLFAGTLLLAVFLYLLFPILTPFVLCGGIVFLLFPLRSNPIIRRVIWLTLILFVIWMISTAASVVVPFVLAFVIAYLLNPFVNAVTSRGVARWIPSAVAILLLIGVTSTAIALFLPILLVQAREVVNSLSMWAERAVVYVEEGSLAAFLARYGVSQSDIQSFIAQELPPKFEQIFRVLFGGLIGVLTSVTSIISQMLNIIIVPFVAFYILKDYPSIVRAIRDLLPAQNKATIVAYFTEADDLLNRYLRGQILVSMIQGTIASIVLTILGVDYALLLGILTGILTFIPYVGILTSLFVSTLVALLGSDPTTGKVVGVIVMSLSQKILENTVLGPKIIGTKVGLHPVLLIFSILMFGALLGFVGLLIGVPCTALIVMTFRFVRERSTATPHVVEA